MREASESETVSERDRAQLESIVDEHEHPDFCRKQLFIPRDAIAALERSLRCAPFSKRSSPSLSYLLQGSSMKRIVRPPLETETEAAAPSAALAQRRAYLQRRHEERSYAAMVGNVSFSGGGGGGVGGGRSFASTTSSSLQEDSVAAQMASLNQSLGVILNMVVAIFATFGIAYYVGCQYSERQGVRLAFGLVGAFAIMVVEMTLYIIRTMMADEHSATMDTAAAASGHSPKAKQA